MLGNQKQSGSASKNAALGGDAASEANPRTVPAGRFGQLTYLRENANVNENDSHLYHDSEKSQNDLS
ncbi:hypothetical protein [Pandoraea communis]|uniref:hypothetical protein n=1 Tax=Pandoraea communis TaxID=2508297 RepID=UPI001240FD58|nr:hypothetical protein [Pandoraea communis]